LTGAKLEGADVEGADFRGALLRGAGVDGSSLAKGNLELAELPAAKAGASEAERKPRNAFLVELACGDPYVARGLALQALSSARGDRPGLAAALLEAEDRSECQGVKRLPAAMREALERSPTESVPLPELEDPNHG
jgi:hypothetical protein